MKKWRVACFDLDGTLVTGTSTCRHLRHQLGHGPHTEHFDKHYAAGLMTASDIAHAEKHFYKGKTSEDIARMLETVPVIAGIEDTVAHLQDQGIAVLLTTISWNFASGIMANRFGFDGYSGYVMDYLPDGTLSGELGRECDEFRKRDFVIEFCSERGIPLDQVFAVGDSRSDIPLFQTVGHSVAINATADAIAVASCTLETADLRDVLRLIPGLPSTNKTGGIL